MGFRLALTKAGSPPASRSVLGKAGMAYPPAGPFACKAIDRLHTKLAVPASELPGQFLHRLPLRAGGICPVAEAEWPWKQRCYRPGPDRDSHCVPPHSARRHAAGLNRSRRRVLGTIQSIVSHKRPHPARSPARRLAQAARAHRGHRLCLAPRARVCWG